MLQGLATAFRTLTILPVPGKGARDAASSLPWFPVVGAALGGLLYAMTLPFQAIGGASWPEGVALLVVVAEGILTRGLHLDGLADWADGFASMTDRTETLRIMKDPRVGTFAVLALIAVLGAKWIALTRMVEGDSALWVFGALVVSRTIQVELAVSLPYARDDGTAASIVRGAATRHRVGAWLLAALVLVVVLGPTGPAAFLLGLAIARSLGCWFRRRVGGVTGDLLGAGSEIVETAILVACAALGSRLVDLTGWSWVLR